MLMHSHNTRPVDLFMRILILGWALIAFHLLLIVFISRITWICFMGVVLHYGFVLLDCMLSIGLRIAMMFFE